MFEVKLKTTPRIRWDCFICCGRTGQDYVQARFYENGEYASRIVCQACLCSSSADRAWFLHRRAQECRESAASLDALADELPAMPSYDEWAEANAAAEDEYLKDMPAEERARLGRNQYRIDRHERGSHPNYNG